VLSDITERIQTERKLKRTTKELEDANRHLVQNLQAAEKVQQALLPADQPQFPGLDAAWRFRPCEGLAGDILNIIPLDDTHAGLYVLDVTGHGTAAALLSVTVSRLLSATVMPASLVWKQRRRDKSYSVASPAEVATELNTAFPWDTRTGQFFTLIYGVIDLETRRLSYVTAGHPPLILARATGEAEFLETKGLPVGLSTEPYEDQTVQLEQGDRFLFYSDGLTDTMNPNNELFTQERLLDVFAELMGRSVEEALDAVMKRVDAWRGRMPLRDDISLLACGLP
jgi:sigma-B regulation protein RsbU (phosphoserine phosphatase)